MLVLGASAVTTASLAALPGPAALLIAAAVLTGAARGLFTLLQATAITDRWGPTHYGHLNGLLTAPALIATALAPWAGAALATIMGGYQAVFWLLTGLTALAVVPVLGSIPRPREAAAAPASSVNCAELHSL